MASALDLFEGMLSGREYLMGEFSAADCAAWPFVRYATQPPPPQDDELFHRILTDYQPLGTNHPAVAAWIERVTFRPQV